jgi:hypothetical protein
MLLLPITSSHGLTHLDLKELKENLQTYIIIDFLLALAVVDMITDILNLPTLWSRQRLLNALSLTGVLKRNLSSPSIFHTINLRVPTKSVRDISTFDFYQHDKVSLSARHVSLTNVVCRYIDNLKESSFLTDIVKSFNKICNNI